MCFILNGCPVVQLQKRCPCPQPALGLLQNSTRRLLTLKLASKRNGRGQSIPPALLFEKPLAYRAGLPFASDVAAAAAAFIGGFSAASALPACPFVPAA